MSQLRKQFDGREFDWFSVDGEGHLAHFSTAGFGPVPTEILRRFVEADALPDQLLQLPVIGKATGHLNGKSDEWLEMARRGLYSFDWSPSGFYARAATPSVALHVSTVPEPLLAESPIFLFGAVAFARLLEFNPRVHCVCE